MMQVYLTWVHATFPYEWLFDTLLPMARYKPVSASRVVSLASSGHDCQALAAFDSLRIEGDTILGSRKYRDDEIRCRV
jgi:hypothetical protein